MAGAGHRGAVAPGATYTGLNAVFLPHRLAKKMADKLGKDKGWAEMSGGGDVLGGA